MRIKISHINKRKRSVNQTTMNATTKITQKEVNDFNWDFTLEDPINTNTSSSTSLDDNDNKNYAENEVVKNTSNSLALRFQDILLNGYTSKK